MRLGPRLRVAVLVGVAVAATVLASAIGSRPSSPVTPVETNQAITSIRSSLEPAALLTKLQSGSRFLAKHREGKGRDQLGVVASATVVALALGHVVVAGRPGLGMTPRVRRAWAQRAPPICQHS